MITENEQEFFEERAAIIEYDGGIPRPIAEWEAYDQMVNFFQGKSSMQPVVERQTRVFTAGRWTQDGDHPNVKPHNKRPGCGIVFGKHGPKLVNPGDWVVRKARGIFGVYSDAEFKRKFQSHTQDGQPLIEDATIVKDANA